MCALRVNHIFDLPEDLLQHIISFLPLSDRKSASLVCSVWRDQAFSFTSMDCVKLCVKELMVENRDFDVLLKTTRRYRHLVLTFGHRPCNNLDLARVMKLVARLGDSIQSFILLSDYNEAAENEQFPVMEYLKEIRARSKTLKDLWPAAPNIRRLSVHFSNRENSLNQSLDIMARYGPQLQFLELCASFIRVRFDQFNLGQLQSLKLWNVNTDRDEELLCKMFEKLPLLRTAFLHFSLSADLLRVICSECPRLVKLRIRADKLDGDSVRYVNKLKGLRVLFVDGHMKSDFLDDCSVMNSVEYFSLSKNPLVNDGVPIDRLSNVFPKLRILRMDLSYGLKMNEMLAWNICDSFEHLKCLIIDGMHMCTFGTIEEVSPLAFLQLMQMTSLEELTLSCMRWNTNRALRQVHFECLFTSLFHEHFENCNGEGRPSNVRRLTLKNCYRMTGDSLPIVVRRFPKLRYLEIGRCRMLLKEDAHEDSIRQSLPDCEVRIVGWERLNGPIIRSVD
ncbi:uncharacterized protein LOC134210675 isoform X2 [Armigeres subalbatus]|uniref:uncharacterized protein LOC134210675 isoform X2 n=1 Tax=Armigeres subalbatus TaxID=124917 RepID=UPI002ECFCEDC